MLKKEYIRNGKNQIIGSETSEFSNDDSIVRDSHGKILGRANNRFHTTRDAHGNLVSTNTDDSGLLFEE